MLNCNLTLLVQPIKDVLPEALLDACSSKVIRAVCVLEAEPRKWLSAVKDQQRGESGSGSMDTSGGRSAVIVLVIHEGRMLASETAEAG